MSAKRTATTDQATTDEPADLETSGWQPSGYTGIADVDALLEPVLQDGGVVLASGYTGSGKTTLAGQIAVCLTAADKKVAYLSTEVESEELLVRTLSCAAGWPISELERYGLVVEELVPGVFKPVIRSGNEDFTARALAPYQRLRRNLGFKYLHGFLVAPIAALDQAMTEVGTDVDCIVLDYLRLAGIVDGQLINHTQVATDVMEYLSGFSYEHGIPVFVFCQRNAAGERQNMKEVKAGRVGGISEFPQIEGLADATIELTHPVTRPTERREGAGARTYSDDRHMIVTTNGKEHLIPVLAEFDYQRFAGRDDDGPGDDDSDREFRRRVRSSSARSGCIKFPRDLWETLVATRHQGTALMYVAMVINADHRTGRLHWSEKGLGDLLGLTRKAIRGALTKLQALNLVKTTGKTGSSHCREWEVVDYLDKFQNPDARAYVVLARSLLDETRAELRTDNALAVWLTLLFETRMTPDTDGDLERGQWPVDYQGLAQRLSMSLADVMAVFQRLEDQGRLNRWSDPSWGGEVVKLPNFDQYQRMVPWPAISSHGQPQV